MLRRLLLVLAVLSFVAAACGDDDDGGNSAEATTSEAEEAEEVAAAETETAETDTEEAEAPAADPTQAPTGDDRVPLAVDPGAEVIFTLDVAQAQAENGEAGKKGCLTPGGLDGEQPDGTVATTIIIAGGKTRTRTFKCNDGTWDKLSDVTTDAGITEDPNDDPLAPPVLENPPDQVVDG